MIVASTLNERVILFITPPACHFLAFFVNSPFPCGGRNGGFVLASSVNGAPPRQRYLNATREMVEASE
jgi:hypothetical protein